MGNRKEALLSGKKIYFTDKPCKKCGSLERYVSNYTCVPCSIKTGLEKLNNPELMAPYRTTEKQRKKLKNWRTKNYDKWKQSWLDPEGKPYRNATAAKRRASVRNQTPDDADFELILEIYRKCKLISEETGIPHEVDHIIPIAKGGLHHQNNLQIITKTENRMKGAKLDGKNSYGVGHTLGSQK